MSCSSQHLIGDGVIRLKLEPRPPRSGRGAQRPASAFERTLIMSEDIGWRRKWLVAHFAFPAFVAFIFTPGSSPFVNSTPAASRAP